MIREQFSLLIVISIGNYLRNKLMKIIIIGGVAGGATTAARIRRTNEVVEIILFRKRKVYSYANCGLPYYIGGVIKERENCLYRRARSILRAA